MIYLHKILPLLFSPIFLLIILLAICIFLKKRGFSLLLLIVFYMVSTPIVSDYVFRKTEHHAVKKRVGSIQPADAVVVLSGMLTNIQAEVGTADEWSDPDRFFDGIKLYQANKAPILIFTKGQLPWSQSQLSEGDILKSFATQLGVPESKILLTDIVKNTREEAQEVKKLLSTKNPDRKSQIILVTSAFHMPRAKLLFEKEGIEVTPYPVDFKVSTDVMTVMDFLPSARALYLVDIAVREWLGLMYYKIGFKS